MVWQNVLLNDRLNGRMTLKNSSNNSKLADKNMQHFRVVMLKAWKGNVVS